MSEIEKVICTDGGCNNAVLSSLLANQKGDPMAMAAMMNNNNWNNSPWMYLIFLALFGGNGFGFGNRADVAQNADLSRQIQSLSDTTNANNSNQLILSAVNGNREAMGQLAQTFNTDVTAIQTAICSVKSAIEQVSGQIGYSAESVKNAISLGDSAIMNKMCECCNNTQQNILKMGYENQLATERQTNVITSQMAAQHSADQLKDCEYHGQTISRIDQLANGIQQGFAQIGFNQQQNTQAIINNATANTQRILDQMCANQTQALRDSLAEKDRQLQTANIIAGLKASGCGCSC